MIIAEARKLLEIRIANWSNNAFVSRGGKLRDVPDCQAFIKTIGKPAPKFLELIRWSTVSKI